MLVRYLCLSHFNPYFEPSKMTENLNYGIQGSEKKRGLIDMLLLKGVYFKISNSYFARIRCDADISISKPFHFET